jgi:glycosyltransferase involved in cell wall biosynthesis
VKVRDLIAGATFTPGAGRDGPEPRVTVILPTFRRGDDGLLRRALDSLLGQTFEALEVIVVDDASTDSTADVLVDTMRRDPRVSVIRHARNIGLPAVSEYEAYVRARGDLFVFAFDDTVFHPDAIRKLVEASDEHPDTLIAGSIDAFYRDPVDGRVKSVPFGHDTDESDLLAINHIPNNGVLVPRTVLEKVGLYDPHIALARICDYDLWCRIRRRVPITFVPVRVGEEHGPAHADSLGSTYVLDHWAADDRLRQRRDELLSPSRFLDVDVFDIEGFASERTREVVRRLVEGHIRTHPWMSAPEVSTPARRVPRIMVLAHSIDATVQLVFEGLRDVPGIHVRMVDPTRRYIGELAATDVLILARVVRDDWKQAATFIGIPTYYYLDDNLPLMAEAGELPEGDARMFAIDTLREQVAALAGVLTSTEALAESFREQGLHDSVQALPLAAPGFVSSLGTPPARRTGDPVALALFVGPHRLASFRRTLWPAITAAAERTGRRVRVLLPEGSARRLRRVRDERVEVAGFPEHLDYFSALRGLRMAGAEVVVVPPATSVNTPFKTAHPFLSAAVLDARLVAPATAPYLDLADEERLTLVSRPSSTDAWAEALADVLNAGPLPGSRDLERFAPEVGAERLRTAVTAEVPEAEPDVDRRTHQISDWLAHQLAVARIAQAAAAAVPPPHPPPPPPPPPAVLPPLLSELHGVVRRSRRLYALRSAPSPLSIFEGASTVEGFPDLGPGERVELSVPLSTVPYLSYRVSLPAGRFSSARALVWGDGQPGDLVGIEVVDGAGRIALHTIAALPAGGTAVEVSFDASALVVAEPGEHEVRVFVRTDQQAHLVEAVDRGRLGLRRGTPRPVLVFDPVPDAPRADVSR